MAITAIQHDNDPSWTDDEKLYVMAESNLRKLRPGQTKLTQLVAVLRRLQRFSSIADPTARSDTIAEYGGQLKKVLLRFARVVRRAVDARQAKRIRKDARRAVAIARAQGVRLVDGVDEWVAAAVASEHGRTSSQA